MNFGYDIVYIMLNKFLNNRLNLILAGTALLILVGGYLGYQKLIVVPYTQGPVEDIDLAFDPEGSYALLVPRRDGKAMILSLTRIKSYDAFAYQLAYTDTQGISRGVGDLDTWVSFDKNKGFYTQEILFGTCSKNICKYDKGVENGTLTLRLKKGNKAYRFNTLWHLQKPQLSLGAISSGDSHLNITLDPKKSSFDLLGFTIVNDLTGAPKLPDGKKVLGRVYAVNFSSPQDLPQADVGIDLADTPSAGAQIGVYSDRNNQWNMLDTKITGSKLSAITNYFGIVAVLVPNK